VSAAFVFIKPHAVTEPVKQFVEKRFAEVGLKINSKGPISADKIDKELLIDTHYGAIASRAMQQKPSELPVQQKAQDDFQTAFSLSWSDALKQGLVYNLVDAAAQLSCNYDEIGEKFDKLTKGKDMIKFGGGFYCGKVGDIYIINGFYAKMRAQFTVPGECIFYYEVQWDTAKQSWADFRNKLLGATDPAAADVDSMRHHIFKNWKELGLSSEPNTGSNGLHASASPFEALAERTNWLGNAIEEDYFCKAMLAAGVPLATIKEWCSDPAVSFAGKQQSLFDLLEEIDGAECLKKCNEICKQNQN
jgi:nucleoside diphosphate kinase